MRILVIGAGGVGSAIAAIAARRSAFEHMTVADIDAARAAAAIAGLDADRFASAQLDAPNREAGGRLAADGRADVILNAAGPGFVMPIFEGAFDAACPYLDMAMSLSQPHPERPYEEPGVMLGDAQL